MKRVLIVVLLASLLGLIWFSHRLAGVRIYHADECQNAFMARVIATGQTKLFLPDTGLFQVGVLSWLARGAAQSVEILVAARFVMLEIFWLNLILIALATGERLLSIRGLAALVGAAALAPLWDFGFEVRPDNLVLCGVLLMWCAVRFHPTGRQPYLIAGALSAGLLCISLRALAFTLPISAAMLAFPPRGQGMPRRQLAIAWVAAAVGTLLVIVLGYGAAGLWQVHWAQLGAATRKWSWWHGEVLKETLGRLLQQTPLLLAVTVAALGAVMLEIKRRGRAALTWDGLFPEALLFAGAFVTLLLTPVPEPYKLLLVIPFAYLLAYRYAVGLLNAVWGRPILRPVLVALLVFGYFVPFGLATRRHLAFTNYHQEARIRLAEGLTDPVRDVIYDGVGMISCRPAIGAGWRLPNVARHDSGMTEGARWKEMLAAHPAAAILPNYRTDQLPAECHTYIKEHYVPLSDDFWVLGKVLPAGGGKFDITHPGRYRIASLKGSDLAGTYPAGLAGLLAPLEVGSLTGTLDGLLLSNRPVELKAGTHTIATQGDERPTVVWVGPKQDRLGRLGESDHRFLFIKWY
jgi:hypothetical protein